MSDVTSCSQCNLSIPATLVCTLLLLSVCYKQLSDTQLRREHTMRNDSVDLKENAKLIMEQADDRLVETQRLAAEAEALGYTTINDLKRQREQLERARQNLYRTDADLDDSNRLMTSMMRRYHKFD